MAAGLPLPASTNTAWATMGDDWSNALNDGFVLDEAINTGSGVMTTNATFATSTTFTTTTDTTATYTPGRRLRIVHAGGTTYCRVASAVFGATTTVTIANVTSGPTTMTSAITSVAFGPVGANATGNREGLGDQNLLAKWGRARQLLGYGVGRALSGAGLTTAQALLTGDVSITPAATYVDGPSISLTTGTWLIIAYATVLGNTGVSNSPGAVTTKLWDGTTVYASAETGNYIGAAGVAPPEVAAMAAIRVISGTTTVKISCASVNAPSTIKAAAVDSGAGNNATGIVAVRIA